MNQLSLVYLSNITWDVEVIVKAMPVRTGPKVEKIRKALPSMFVFTYENLDEDEATQAAMDAATEQHGQCIEDCTPLFFVQA